jgi:hypothetical protein
LSGAFDEVIFRLLMTSDDPIKCDAERACFMLSLNENIATPHSIVTTRTHIHRAAT